MPFIRSLASVRYVLLATSISLNGEIMSPCSCCAKKKLVYIIIAAFSSRQPSFYFKCTKLNIYLSCDIQSVLNIEYAFLPILNLSYFDSSII